MGLLKVVENKSKILAFLADPRPLMKVLGGWRGVGAEVQADRGARSRHLAVFLRL